MRSLLVLLCAMFVLAGGPVLAQGGCASFVVDRELVIDFSGPSPVFQGPPELVALARFDTRASQISQQRLTLELGDAGLHFVDGGALRIVGTDQGTPAVFISSRCEIRLDATSLISAQASAGTLGKLALSADGLYLDGSILLASGGSLGPLQLSARGGLVTGPASRILAEGQSGGGAELVIEACAGDLQLHGLVEAHAASGAPVNLALRAAGAIEIHGIAYGNRIEYDHDLVGRRPFDPLGSDE